MDEGEVFIIKKSIESLQTCLSDLHDRLLRLETRFKGHDHATGLLKGHRFYNKDENGNWLVKCLYTGGTFSTALWKQGIVQNQRCPCCSDMVRREG